MRLRSLPPLAALAAAALASLALPPREAAAQIIRISGPREPDLWASAGVGLLQSGSDVHDGATQSVWRFGTTAQYRASFEKSIANQSSIGVAVTHARAPLTYYDVSPVVIVDVIGNVQLPTDCHNGCDAHANVESLVATFHAGGGIGLHQVIEISAGATRYSNFRLQNGEAVRPDANTDAMLAVGYGFGYPLGRTAELTLVQDAAAVLHERTGLSGGQSALTQFYTTRLGIRIGLGARRPGV